MHPASEILRVAWPLCAGLLLAPCCFAQPGGGGGGGTQPPPVFTYQFVSATLVEFMPAGYEGVANDINNGGDIAGAMWPEHEVYAERPFIHMDGQTFDLIAPNSGSNVFRPVATAINDSRRVVGSYQDEDEFYRVRPFYYYPGIWMTPLPDVPNDLSSARLNRSHWPHAINNAGVVVGYGSVEGDLPPTPSGMLCDDRPVSWMSFQHAPSPLFCIPDLGNDGNLYAQGEPRAFDINNSGAIVGVDGGTTAYGMFLFKDGQTTGIPAPMGVPLTRDSKPLKGTALGINNNGRVVGTFGHFLGELVATIDGINPTHEAFFWDGVSSASESLGALPGGSYSDAREINSQDMVAGNSNRQWSNVPGQPKTKLAFVWHRDFGMKQLPSLAADWYPGSGFQFIPVPRECKANAINNRKSSGIVQVVGWCLDEDHARRAVRWDIQVNVE